MNQVKVKRIRAGHYEANVNGIKFSIYSLYCESKPQWIIENQYEEECYCFEFKNYAIEALQHWSIDTLNMYNRENHKLYIHSNNY